MSSPSYVAGIEVMWRPGCPFCMRLRSSLKRRGITTTDIDIWSTEGAAERVRAATGGDETVPTVFVGDCALVNPSVKQIIEAVERELPERVEELVPVSSKVSLWRRVFGLSK